MTARKFWDSDLRRDPNLVAVAVSYAKQYEGDWEFLVNARELVMAAGSLPIGTARAVLNAMRIDPDVRGLRLPERRLYVVEDQVTPEPPAGYVENAQSERFFPPQPVKESESLQGPISLRVPARVKAKYGASGRQGKGRRVLHRINPDETYIEWEYPYDKVRRRYIEGPRVNKGLHVGWVCSSALRTVTNPCLYQERSEVDLPYCRSGCFGVICPRCMKMNTLRDDQAPDTVIEQCERCGIQLEVQ